MARPRWAAVLAAAACAGLAAACARPSPTPRAPKACIGLANSFVLVASERQRGASAEEQAEVARAHARSEAGLRHWLRVIDLVYRFEDGSPREIGATVLDHCSVDERGRAAVTTLWPGNPNDEAPTASVSAR